MDKYEYKLKLEQLQNLMAAGDYATASEMADTINWKKVRSSNTLCMVSDIYEKTEKYDACREVLLQAYDHSPIGRNIVCLSKQKGLMRLRNIITSFLRLHQKTICVMCWHMRSAA